MQSYREYIRDNPKGYWFKRKLYGWGWTPAKWQGWVVISIYILAVLSVAFMIDESTSSKETLIRYILPLLALTYVLIRILYIKGEKPRWQWGIRGERE